jgi:peptidoglycan/xylan/chitin deacetylase (PgdA/CDA1 family)
MIDQAEEIYDMFRFRILSFMLLICLSLSFSYPLMIFAETLSPGQPEQDETFQMLKSGKRPVTQVANYVTPEQPTVYLTFDDGPSKLTGKVLDILQKEGIKATFFMIGEEAESHPELVKRVVKEGHSIGNHSYNHVYKELYTDYDNFWKQIEQTEQILFKLVGFNPQLIRAPGGTSTNFDAFYFYYLEQAGYIVTDWTVDSGDSDRRNVPAEEIICNIEKASLRHEMTVLMHDGSGHGTSVEALPEVIRYFKEKGYVFSQLTPEVKPIQFPVVKTKWNRSISFSHYKEQLKGARAYTAFQSSQNVESQTKETVITPVPTIASSKDIPLIMNVDNQVLMFQNDTYNLDGNQVDISLRSLFERLGGEVIWLQEKRTAMVHFGFYDVAFDVTNHTIQLNLYGKQIASYHLVEMKLEDGMIRVPLSQTISLVGGKNDRTACR